MKIAIPATLALLAAPMAYASDLVLSGVIDGPLSGGTPKAVELYVKNDISDLSRCGLGSANNGGGSDGQEFTFDAVPVAAGTYLYVASESAKFTAFMGFAPDYTSGAMGINGDDAVELFCDGNVVDTFGDITVDGTGQAWEYLDGWAYRNAGTDAQADGSFILNDWIFSGPNMLDSETSNATAGQPFPVRTFGGDAGGGSDGGDGGSVTAGDILIAGVVDADLSGGLPKLIELYVVNDIADLSVCGVGSANNGGGSDGEEFTLSGTASAGDTLYIASESTAFTNYFGFAPTFTSSAANINGDDAIELFCNNNVVDVFGDINSDGTGQVWEYKDGWAYRKDTTGPDGSTFVADSWTFAKGELDGASDNASASTPYPIASFSYQETLIITGVIDAGLSGGTPKAVEFYAVTDIADLSRFGFGSANNGQGTDGQEYTFSGSASAGDYLYIASESTNFTAFFGFAPTATNRAANINGDDAIELFRDGAVVDTFGDIDTDGTGQPWEYMDGWAYRNTGTGPDGTTFVLGSWSFSGKNALDGQSDNDSATTPFPVGSFANGDGGGSVELGACFDTSTNGFAYLSAVQGNSDASPLAGQQVIVEGVVTGLRDGGFFLQEEVADQDADTTSSEGIFVLSDVAVTLGNTLRLAGSVVEFYGLTEIKDVTASLDCGIGGAVSTVDLMLPLSEGEELEHYEGMLVRVNDLVVTSTNNMWRYGELALSTGVKRQPTDVAAPLTAAYQQQIVANQSDLIWVEDNSNARFPAALSFFTGFSYANPIRIGDTVSASGPLNYSFSKFRVNPQSEITVLGEREATPTLNAGNLSIATFNVLNYFNGELVDGVVSFDYPQNRGAENAQEFALQEARIIDAIVAMDADVIGLMEIENDGFGENSAIQQLVNGVNAQLSAENAYSFVSAGDAVGTDAIAVGLLYRASKVSLLNEAVKIPMPVQTLSSGGLKRMRVSLLQSFTHNESGQEFAVVVNHFKSKGSTCEEDNNAPSELDQVQGSCNAFRVSAAVTLGEALKDPSLPERIMILGDLNAYSQEDPLAVLTNYDPAERGYTIKTAVNTAMDSGNAVEVTDTYGFTNVAKAYDADGYSYWYHGTEQVGSLDHILANNAMLADIVDATHWNINSVEAYQLQYDQALSYYKDADGYAFTDVGPYRSSDHDPFIVGVEFTAAASLPGDWDGDGDVDIRDVRGLFYAIIFRREIDSAFDLNGDGRINILDVFRQMRMCTRARCAV